MGRVRKIKTIERLVEFKEQIKRLDNVDDLKAFL